MPYDTTLVISFKHGKVLIVYSLCQSEIHNIPLNLSVLG